MKKVTKEFIVKNEKGLHIRPSVEFVSAVNKFHSNIKIYNEIGDITDGRSVLGILCLMASKGTKLKIVAEGNDASDVIKTLNILFKNKFNRV